MAKALDQATGWKTKLICSLECQGERMAYVNGWLVKLLPRYHAKQFRAWEGGLTGKGNSVYQKRITEIQTLFGGDMKSAMRKKFEEWHGFEVCNDLTPNSPAAKPSA